MQRIVIAMVWIVGVMSYSHNLQGQITHNQNNIQNQGPYNQALIILDCKDISEMGIAKKHIEESGGKIFLLYPTHCMVGNIPKNLANRLIGTSHIEKICYSALNLDDVPYKNPITHGAIVFWNELKSGSFSRRPSIPDPGPIKNDALPNPFKEESPDSTNLKILTENLGTSDNMTGAVAACIFFPESNGQIDPNTENWTTDMVNKVISEVSAGLLWWAARADSLAPTKNLSFIVLDPPSETPTRYEPIRRPQTDEGLWIKDVMADIGRDTLPSYLTVVALFNEYLKAYAGANHSFSIFVVNSLNDYDGEFADGLFAYAYLGGPLMVMTYDLDSAGIDNMDAATAHETGHIFGAFDEYASSGCKCKETQNGYPNYNCQNSCPSDVACIMRGGTTSYAYNAVCYYTQGHIGWDPAGVNEPPTKVIPKEFLLMQSYPNPFKKIAIIKYSISKACHVISSLHDITGKPVRTLLDATQKPGYYESAWDGRDDQGLFLPNGIYFYLLQAGSYSNIKKLILLR